MVLSYIGIGSNIGDPLANVTRAIDLMAQAGSIVARSSYYRTKAWGVVDQPDFCNAAVQLNTQLPPQELLIALKHIEQTMGRTATYRWGPRIIDLDILTYGDLRLSEPDLIIPHPGLYERATVLVPLAEIAATYSEARDRLSKQSLDDVQVLS
jgi:2-amino-4-hydroxy-6-hydroxymethyldihydropteridine diphosphokinase